MKNNLKIKAIFVMAAGLLIGLSSCKNDDNNAEPQIEARVLTAQGDSTAIAGTLNEYRALLGEPLNREPNKTSGRREIDWDGVPAAFTNTNTFPGDFFNTVGDAVPNGRKRGAVFTTPGTGLRVSDNDFTDLTAGYSSQFAAFSPVRTFAAVGSNIVEVAFQVPGQTAPASVKGFGVVFSDVDDAGSTYMEFFDGNRSLGKFNAPTRTTAAGFSFLGVFFPNEKVTKVRIVSGNGALGTDVKDKTDGGQYDLVIMDDFLYSEPLPLP
ncbi:MAG: hypothetical protein MUD08_04715 [Cytophagales bacterium]|jgi:hypothetical protein|nr:hypothetical protein [Cytophagales bacterium]